MKNKFRTLMYLILGIIFMIFGFSAEEPIGILGCILGGFLIGYNFVALFHD